MSLGSELRSNVEYYNSDIGKNSRKELKLEKKKKKQAKIRKVALKYYYKNIKPLLIEASLKGKNNITLGKDDKIYNDIFSKKRYVNFFHSFLVEEGLHFEHEFDLYESRGFVKIHW